jgi:hypothetical protein
MEKNALKLLGKAMDAAMKLDKCGKAKCKEEYKAVVKENNVMLEKLQVLGKKLTGKKITPQAYTEQTHKILEEMKGTSVKMALLSCTLKECKPVVSNTLNVLGDVLANECVREKKKKACSTEKKVRDLANAKEITPKQYLKVRDLVQQH